MPGALPQALVGRFGVSASPGDLNTPRPLIGSPFPTPQRGDPRYEPTGKHRSSRGYLATR
jgi:hypothetical protein